MKKRIKKDRPKLYSHKKTGFFAGFFKLLLTKIIFRKMQYIYHSEAPTEPSILVGNHTKFYAPLAVQYTYPENVRTWSMVDMMETKPSKALFRNRILQNIKGEKFLRLLVPIVVPFITLFYRKQLNAIPVYHDFKIKSTMDISVDTLINASHVAIYPEIREIKFNQYINGFASGFAYLAYSYYLATGKKIKFYPFYCAPSLQQVHFGNPIEYDPDISIKEQAEDIARYLEKELTRVADSLPVHKISAMMGDIFHEGA